MKLWFNDSDTEESGDDESIEQVVTPSQTYEALDTTMKWLESQDYTDHTHLLVKKWRDMAAMK